jgi:hypothetical protein
MGKSSTLSGGSKHSGNVDLFTKEQKNYLSGILSKGTTNKAKQNYQGFLESGIDYDIEGMLGSGQDAFQKGVVDPMMQQYQQQVLPATQQRFVDANAGSSSALNQALATGANDLTTQMGQMYLPFMQHREDMRADLYKNQELNRLNALSGLSGLAGMNSFTPMINQRQGILGPLIGAGGQLGGAAIMASSEKVKENIRPYEKGLEVIKNLAVKIYDYKKELGGSKNRVGVIAEQVPTEISAEIDGIKAVDMYGLIGLLINSVKELNEKIEQLQRVK